MSRENDSVIFKLLKSADVINDGTQEISQQFDGESYPKLPEANMLELGEVALNIAKDYEVIAIKNNEGEIVYIPFNVAIRLLTLEGDVANLTQYTLESVDALSAATVSIYNNLEEFKVEISNRLTQEIKKITDVIPNDTTSGNPLTNEAFVNSSISTNTATFRGTFNLVSDLHLTTSATTYEIAAALADVIPTSDNNDYSYVQIPTSDGEVTEIQKVDRYKYNGTNWVFEYSLNNSGFTSKQWAAINSGIVAGLVVKLEDLPDKAALDALLDSKQDVLTFDNTPTLGSTNPVTSDGIKVAIDDETERAMEAERSNTNALNNFIQDMNAVIPSGTSSSNKLINESQKGAANGIASLGPNGKVLGEQLNFTFRGRINASMINDNSLEAGMYSIIGQNISGIFNNANGCLIQISDEYHTQILCVGRAPGTAEGTVVETFVRRYLNSANSWTEWSNSLRSYYTKTQIDNLLNQKQPTLVSGTNIKTINGNHLLGAGNLDVNNVFIAEYGVTTFQDVLNAYNNGKIIYCVQSGIYSSYYVLRNASSSFMEFISIGYVDPGNGARGVIGRFVLSSTGYSSIFTVELQQYISNLNEISTKAISAYQKPSTGIPASDLAQGVIPDVSDFITRSVNDLANYYLKSETYTKTEVQGLIGTIQQFHYEIYASLQDITTPAANVLYLIGPSGSGNDRYEEYVYANNDFTKIGDTSIDLSGYVTTQALNTALAAKQDTLISGENIKSINGNSILGSGDVSIHPEIVNLTDGEHSSGFYEELMRATGVLKLDTPQIFIYTAYNNNHIATTAMCFSTCTNTETPTTNAVIKQTLFLGTFKSVRTLSNTVSGDSYQVVDNWAQILDVKQSDLNAKVSKSGDAMTGDLNLNGHELQVRAGRSGIKFTGTGTEQGIYVGNPNMRLFLEADANLDLVHKKGDSYPKILDEGNVKTINGEDIYGSGNITTNGVFWVEYYTTPFADILAAYNAGKLLFANYAGYKFVNVGVITDNDTVTMFTFSAVGYGDSGAYILSFTVTSNDGSTEYSNIDTTRLQEGLISGTNIKTINGNSILGSGDLDVNNVFIATYNQTSINDLNDAYNDGKILVVVSGSQTFLCQRKINTTTNNWSFRFAGIDAAGRIQTINCATTDNAATWSWTTVSTEKTTSVSSSSNDFQLPTAKAVYDFVQGQISNFITVSVDNLTNYYLKSETYTQTEINNLIGAIQQFHYEIYASLEDITTPATNVLYLIGPSGSGNDRYEEYVYANDTFVKIGDTSIDLSGYVTTQALNTALANYVTSTDLATLLSGKQDKIDATHKLNADLVDDSNSNNKFVTITFRQF